MASRDTKRRGDEPRGAADAAAGGAGESPFPKRSRVERLRLVACVDDASPARGPADAPLAHNKVLLPLVAGSATVRELTGVVAKCAHAHTQRGRAHTMRL